MNEEHSWLPLPQLHLAFFSNYAMSMPALPITLSGVDHWEPVLPFNAHLKLDGLQVALKCVHTANVEPNILL